MEPAKAVMRVCKMCNYSKSKNKFWADKNRKDGLQFYCKDCHRKIRRLKYNLHKEKEKRRIQCLRWRKLNRDSWNSYFPKKIKCQVCLKEVFFNGTHRNNTINFDHRQECVIKTAPSKFLNSHVFNETNKKLWESCNFGTLCLSCNILLPTRNRNKWLKRVNAYIKDKV